jgi:hypothetical protein
MSDKQVVPKQYPVAGTVKARAKTVYGKFGLLTGWYTSTAQKKLAARRQEIRSNKTNRFQPHSFNDLVDWLDWKNKPILNVLDLTKMTDVCLFHASRTSLP